MHTLCWRQGFTGTSLLVALVLLFIWPKQRVIWKRDFEQDSSNPQCRTTHYICLEYTAPVWVVSLSLLPNCSYYNTQYPFWHSRAVNGYCNHFETTAYLETGYCSRLNTGKNTSCVIFGLGLFILATVKCCLKAFIETAHRDSPSFPPKHCNQCFFPPHLPVSAESHTQHGRPPFVHRDDRTSKTYERLQKKLKDRQGGGGQVKDSPPPSPQKSCSSPSALDIQNGVGGKGVEAEQGQTSHAVAGIERQMGRGKNGDSGGMETLEK